MPLPLATIFRGLLLLALGTHVFYMYGLARTMGDGFGFDVGRAVAAALFALVMLLPLVWAVMLPDLPEIISRQVRGRHWWKQGRCPSCGYAMAGREGEVCPECGEASIEPRGYHITGRTVRRYVVLNLIAWMIGSGASESWISADEASFRTEVAQMRAEGNDGLVRIVRWPGRGLYVWEDGRGMMRARGGTMLVGPGGSLRSPEIPPRK